jgi:uncharacterized membrane protein
LYERDIYFTIKIGDLAKMKWLHGLFLSGSIVLFIFGVVVLHVLLNSAKELLHFYFFGWNITLFIAADMAFFFLGVAFFIILLMYFTKQREQIITLTGTDEQSAQLQIKRHQIVEAIFVIRPEKRSRPIRVHIAQRKNSATPIPLIKSLDVNEIMTLPLQPAALEEANKSS